MTLNNAAQFVGAVPSVSNDPAKLMDDLTLIKHIQEHDQEAMVTLHQRYVDLVFSIAYRVLNDRSLAEECVQDTFMKIWQNAGQFDMQRGSLTGWLVGITRNTAIDRLRQQQHRQPENSLDDRAEQVAAPDQWGDREQAEQLRVAIRDLPAEQIQVIELSYFGGLSQTEIAEKLGIPLGTIKTRMRLGMQKLREIWLKE